MTLSVCLFHLASSVNPKPLELLCARRKPIEPNEIAAAHGIVVDLGCHALAIDVSGAALAAGAGLSSYAQFQRQTREPYKR